MSSQALAKAEPETHAGAAPDFYQTRDRMMRAYNPCTEEERLLVTQIAHAWLRLQRFYELESKMLAATDLFELFTKDVEKYKLLTRGVAEAERMWRHAVEMFERARRRTKPAGAVTRPQRSVSFSSRAQLAAEASAPPLCDAQASTCNFETERESGSDAHPPHPRTRPLALV